MAAISMSSLFISSRSIIAVRSAMARSSARAASRRGRSRFGADAKRLLPARSRSTSTSASIDGAEHDVDPGRFHRRRDRPRAGCRDRASSRRRGARRRALRLPECRNRSRSADNRSARHCRRRRADPRPRRPWLRRAASGVRWRSCSTMHSIAPSRALSDTRPSARSRSISSRRALRRIAVTAAARGQERDAVAGMRAKFRSPCRPWSPCRRVA